LSISYPLQTWRDSLLESNLSVWQWKDKPQIISSKDVTNLKNRPWRVIGNVKVPLANPVFDDEMRAAAIDSLQNEKFVMGESVFKFEEEFADFCGAKRAISTSSGSFALQLSLQALDINSKDQVLTTPFSFIATANSAYNAGAIPIFADIDPKTCNLSAFKAKEKLSNDVKTILPVHLYGCPADMESILEMAEGKTVVEDCCQSHGAKYKGKRVGTIGVIGCFSFYSAKNMTVGGDGGMAITNNEDLADMIAKLRDCGRISHYEHDVIGLTARLNTVNAAIGRIQLRRLDAWNEKRRKVAREYNRLLSDIENVELPPLETSEISPVHHLYVVKTDRRNELKSYLETNQIQCGVHYPIPIHLQPIYRKLYGYKEGDFPQSELAAKKVLSLPMYPDMSTDCINQVSSVIHDFFSLQ
jgi:perosamine synthetase